MVPAPRGSFPVCPSSTRNRWQAMVNFSGEQDSSDYRIKSGLGDAICIDPWYAFLKRTRTSQKISMNSGRTLRIKYNGVLNRVGDKCSPRPTAESNLNGRFDGPRKKDPAAMNRPKHMRQRWRAMRL